MPTPDVGGPTRPTAPAETRTDHDEDGVARTPPLEGTRSAVASGSGGAAPGSGGKAPAARGWLNWPFLVAVGLLGTTAILGGPVAEWLQLVRNKKPLPLVAPLQTMNRDALGPYRVVRVDILRSEELEALGTDDVISWWLEDSRPRSDGDESPRLAHVVVTYYTGTPSLVPHTPERCFVAQGYQPSQAHEYREVHVANLPPEMSEVPIRVLTFRKTGIYGGAEQSVIYTFFCNGRFTASAYRVRGLTVNPFVRHAFFSKVEVSVIGEGREQAVRVGTDVLSYLLPELLARHWPDFEAAEAR